MEIGVGGWMVVSQERKVRLRWSHRRWQEQRRWKGYLRRQEVERLDSSVSSSNGVLVP